MSRTKNRGFQQSFSPSYTIRRWRLGEYIRLSKEDLKKGKDDSNSVKNQRDLLNDFYQKHIEEFESVSEYVDDGHTGTDANRENFQRLLADVMSGKINCVVVKDLSRFARNYSDAGSLIDNLFVQMGVRFISLAENVDSYLNPDSVSSIIVPITNVMNDQYCYQTSKKIRQVFDYKRRNGQYIGSFAPYGYIKDPKDKHQLIVDPEAAEIVKLIYNMTLQGETRRAIVYHLNDHGIPSPTSYRKNKGLPYSCAVSDNPMWGDRVLTNILTNPIYTGDLVQGRRRVKSYKVHEIEAVPEDEWVRVADTHEAIIDRETFEKVQALLKRDTRTAPRKKELHLFSGFLRCADCGKSITRSQSGKMCITPALPTNTAPGPPAPCTQSSMSGWRPPSCLPSVNRYIWLFLFGDTCPHQFGSSQKKPVIPTGRSDCRKGKGTGENYPIQTVSLSRLERRGNYPAGLPDYEGRL